jgi:peptidoglycan hydrolase-like protein with peptidoglycan-binding domain
MKTYKLTSPAMRGKEVRRAQGRLAGANIFKENYKPGKGDGVFGEQTAGAAYRAKYWLGYPTKELRRTYGPTLEAYLSGKAKLSTAYNNRRRARKKAKAQVPLGTRALREAIKHLDKKESPAGSNRISFSTWYGIIGPWCAMFCTFNYVKVGSKAFAKGSRYAYVPYIVSAARLGGRGLAITSNPKPGDLVCFDWEHNGVSDHVGLFEKWMSGGNFSCIEGNTSTSNDSNGGEVMRRTRNRSQVQAFVHVTK